MTTPDTPNPWQTRGPWPPRPLGVPAPAGIPARAAGHLAAEPVQQIQALFVPARMRPAGYRAAGGRWPPCFNHSPPPGGTTNTTESNMKGYQ